MPLRADVSISLGSSRDCLAAFGTLAVRGASWRLLPVTSLVLPPRKCLLQSPLIFSFVPSHSLKARPSLPLLASHFPGSYPPAL